MFIWVFYIINHLWSKKSSTIAKNFYKFQVIFLLSWMSWMSITTKMTFISKNEMHIISSVKKYSLPTRELWVHITSNVCTSSLTKIMIWHLPFLCPTKMWRMFFKSWMQLWLFTSFVLINTLPNVYFVIVLMCNVIHKMLLYVIQGVFPFF